MTIKQIYTGCLAQGAYYIESNGEVAIIDPLREVQQYIDMAEADGATIKYIFETHFHADFVSGHVSLSEKTSAENITIRIIKNALPISASIDISIPLLLANFILSPYVRYWLFNNCMVCKENLPSPVT